MAGIAEHERQQEVLRLLDVDGRVSVTDLVRRFGVTAVTIHVNAAKVTSMSPA